MGVDYKARDIHVIELSDMGRDHSILSPQMLALNLPKRATPLDVGVFAFSVRGRLDSRKGTYWVDENSLVPSRKKLIIALLDFFYISGARPGSINTAIKNFEYGVSWCDANGCVDVFCDPQSARTAYFKYSNHLFQNILSSNGGTPLTNRTRQMIFRRVLQLQFPESYENIVAGVSSISCKREGLEPPEKESVSNYLDVTLNIALTFSRFLIDGAPFPLRFEAPSYHTYIFPGNGHFVTPYSPKDSSYNAYDFVEGRIKSISEVSETGIKEALVSVSGAHKNLQDANSDQFHTSRMRIASLAMLAYASVINMVVGANSSELTQFLYDDALELVKSPLKKELSAVKLRAQGLGVRYPIGRGPGLQILKEYLLFREWVLNGRDCAYLFFKPIVNSPAGRVWGSEKLNPDYSNSYFKRVRGVFLPDNFKNISPARIRKYKSLTLHLLRHSPFLVSAVMNHLPNTNLQSYSGIGVTDHKAEFSSYWEAVRKAAARARDADQKDSVSIATGHCGGMNSPIKDIPVVAIEPDCSSPYGCLFCENYQVHSDETDVFKLTSFQYVIDAIRRNAPVISFSEETFRDLAVRIEFVLDAISKKSEPARVLVEEVRRKVFDLGILTPFWEQRLQRYEKMGIYL